MIIISKEELNEILERHKKWLNGEDGKQAKLRNTDLQNVCLRKVDLRNADLTDADLRGSDLREADLRYADLYGANLQNTNLNETKLSGANLGRANLWRACVLDADLQNAELINTDLRGVFCPWLIYTGAIGSERSETLYFANKDVVQCDCWYGTLAEFKARVDDFYPANNEKYFIYRAEYISAIKMFQSMREAYLKSLGERQ